MVVVDAAQAAPQLPIDLAWMPEEERPDLLAFTGHKVVGPTGIGVLWGRRAVLDQLPPFLGGGEMIETVTKEGTAFAPVLDTRAIAVRAGHHCAKPAHQRYGVQSSTRMSSYLYTTPAEIDALVEGLEYTRNYFKLD